MSKPVCGGSDQVLAVQSQKMARGLKFRIYEVDGLYYPYSENKGADQLRGYREADLRLCFRIYAKSRFSHNEAQIYYRAPHISVNIRFRSLSFL